MFKKMMRILFLCSLTVSSYAQAPDTLWARHYGYSAEDQAWQVKSTADDGFIIVGYADVGDPSDLDLYIILTDENGDSIWTRTLDCFTQIDIGRSVAMVDDGGFVITGYNNGFTYNDDLVLFKIDPSGNGVWFHVFSDASGRSVKVTDDGGLIVAGFCPGSGSDTDMYISRHDSSGALIWNRPYGGLSNEKAWDICETEDGGFLILGWTESFGNGLADMYVVRTDGNGEEIWSRTYGGNYNDEGRSLLLKDDGGFLIAGKISSTISSGNATVICADSSGDVIWMTTLSDTVLSIANSIARSADGGYIITGMRRDINYMYTSFITKINAGGDSLWSRLLIDTERNLYCQSIVQSSDGGYVVAGYHQVPNRGNDVFLCKLAPDVVGISDEISILPKEITLHQNYPNPFNANTTISFELAEPGNAVLSIYDLLGRKIAVMADGYIDAGAHNVIFDAGELSSGVYFYNLKAGGFSESKSMILLK